MATVNDRINNDVLRDPPLYEAYRRGRGSYLIARDLAPGITPRHLRRRFHLIEQRMRAYLDIDPADVAPRRAAEVARRAARAYWKAQGVPT